MIEPTGVETQEHGPLFFCRRGRNDFDDYQQWTRSTGIYPAVGTGRMTALSYAVLGLAGEAGEVAGKLKKVQRDKGGRMDAASAAALGAELGDVLWYVARIADELGFELSGIARSNRDKITSRQERGVIKGSGDDR